jgi:hypothetical protein
MILHDIDVRSDRIVYESVTDLIIRFVDLGVIFHHVTDCSRIFQESSNTT